MTELIIAIILIAAGTSLLHRGDIFVGLLGLAVGAYLLAPSYPLYLIDLLAGSLQIVGGSSLAAALIGLAVVIYGLRYMFSSLR